MTSETLEPVLRAIEGRNHVMFFCPGCKTGHQVAVADDGHPGAVWGWNGDMVRPTFTPSVLTWHEHPDTRQRYDVCHSFVTDGQIQFLSDCMHELAGQTVPLPAISAWR